MQLHHKIRSIRLIKNLTQNYLADELGIDVANYSRLERGETSISVDRLKKIAQILEVNLNELINEEKEEFDPHSDSKILSEILKEIKEIRKSLKGNNQNN